VGHVVESHLGETNPVAKWRQTSLRVIESISVSVETKNAERVKAFEERLGVTAKAERPVDQHSARSLEGWGEKFKATVSQDGDVLVGGHHVVSGFRLSDSLP
jgi:hypothetical protein